MNAAPALIALCLVSCGGIAPPSEGAVDASAEAFVPPVTGGDDDGGDLDVAHADAALDAATDASQACATDAGAFSCTSSTAWVWADGDASLTCFEGRCPTGSVCFLGGFTGTCE